MQDAEKGRAECNHIDSESPSQDETAPTGDKDTVEQAYKVLTIHIPTRAH